MSKNLVLKQIADPLYKFLNSVKRTNNINETLKLFHCEDAKNQAIFNDVFDDIYIIGMGYNIFRRIVTLPFKEYERIGRNVESIQNDALLFVCDKLNIRVPQKDVNFAKYLLAQYNAINNTVTKTQMNLNKVEDFVEYGGILAITLKNGEISVYLAWKNNGDLGKIDYLYGIGSEKVRIFQLMTTSIHASRSFPQIYNRIVSLLNDQYPTRIEDYLSLMLRKEISRELSQTVCILGEHGCGNEEIRWHGDVIAIPFLEFEKLPFFSENIAKFANLIGNVASAIEYGNKSIIQKLELFDDHILSALHICVNDNSEIYQQIIQIGRNSPVSLAGGIGGMIVSAQIMKPYENQVSMTASNDYIHKTGGLGIYWRHDNLDKTIARITLGFLPFYPNKVEEGFALQPINSPYAIPDYDITLFAQFGKYIDIVIPHKYGKDAKLSDCDAVWLDSVREKIYNFGYSYLCSQFSKRESIFGDKISKLINKSPFFLQNKITQTGNQINLGRLCERLV